MTANNTEKETKTCWRCTRELELNDINFGKDSSRRDGYAHACRSCTRQLVSDYQRKNRERKRFWNRSSRIRRRYGLTREFSFAQWLLKLNAFDYSCGYCGDPLQPDQITEDHIRPLSKGGADTTDNTVPACRHCNCTKARNEWQPLTPSQVKQLRRVRGEKAAA